jgi:hypothetical protein
MNMFFILTLKATRNSVSWQVTCSSCETEGRITSWIFSPLEQKRQLCYKQTLERGYHCIALFGMICQWKWNSIIYLKLNNLNDKLEFGWGMNVNTNPSLGLLMSLESPGSLERGAFRWHLHCFLLWIIIMCQWRSGGLTCVDEAEG